jgi:16S rRNA pseudouridine516 synthase
MSPPEHVAAVPICLRSGVLLDDEPVRRHAAACERTGARALRLTLTEGRYQQVKRMVAAAGHRVERLHRSAFGLWVLPGDLKAAQWQRLDAGHGSPEAASHP